MMCSPEGDYSAIKGAWNSAVGYGVSVFPLHHFVSLVSLEGYF